MKRILGIAFVIVLLPLVAAAQANLAKPTLTAEVKSDSIYLSWNSISDANYYFLWSWEKVEGWKNLSGEGLQETSFEHSDIHAGATYYYYVAAVNADGQRGPWSEPAIAPFQTLPAPTLSVSLTDNTASLEWTEVAGASRYTVSVRTATAEWATIDNGALTGTNFVHSSLSSDTYRYTVAALNARGNRGAWAEPVDITVPEGFAAPEVEEEPTATPTAESVLSGITIAPENRCSEYDSDDYSYPQSVEPEIITQQGGRIYSPYSGTYFTDRSETDIEHIVARSEAHDSGLCAVTVEKRREFARDLANLTLASPSLNRHQKGAKDLAEWLPTLNQCWYANQVVVVKRKYSLTMDQAEADKAKEILGGCESTAMIFAGEATATPTPTATPGPTATATPTPVPTPTMEACRAAGSTYHTFSTGGGFWGYAAVLHPSTLTAYINTFGEDHGTSRVVSIGFVSNGFLFVQYEETGSRQVVEYFDRCTFHSHSGWWED